MIPYFRIKTLKIYTLSGSRYLAHLWIEGPTPGYSDIGELSWNGKQREKVKGRLIKRESFPNCPLSPWQPHCFLPLSTLWLTPVCRLFLSALTKWTAAHQMYRFDYPPFCWPLCFLTSRGCKLNSIKKINQAHKFFASTPSPPPQKNWPITFAILATNSNIQAILAINASISSEMKDNSHNFWFLMERLQRLLSCWELNRAWDLSH